MNELQALTDLDRVPWAALTDAYGSAEPLPALLCALGSADRAEARAALDEIVGRVHHQGQLEPAAPEVVPFLIALLGEASVPDKHRLLRVLRAFTAEAAHDGPGEPPMLLLGRAEPEGAEAAAVMSFRAGYAGLLTRTVRAVAAGGERYLALLTDGDPRVRAAAAFALAPIAEQSGPAREPLRAAIRAETDPLALASELCALGLAGRHVGVVDDAAFLHERLSSNDIAPRAAAAVALAWAASASADEGCFQALSEGARLPPVSVDRFPWHGGALAGPCAEALALLAARHRPRALRALTEAVVARLDRGDADPVQDAMPAFDLEALLAGTLPSAPPPPPLGEQPDDEPVGSYAALETVSAVAERLLRLTFAGFEGRRDDELTWDELGEEQRAVVRALGFASLETSAIGLGLLVEGKDRARFAGLTPRGPLDEPLVIDGRSQPGWKWLRLVRRGALPEAALAAALKAQRTPDEIRAFVQDAQDGAYVPGGYDGVLHDEILPRLLEAAGASPS
jgi:hypothetical protein